jgi:hypothetical protein
MSRRKRGHDEMEASEPPKEKSMLEKIRNMWEFASLYQYIYTFGDAVKIDRDLDIEVRLQLLPAPSDGSFQVIGGAVLTLGLANGAATGSRDRMFDAWPVAQIRRNWPDSAQMDIITSRTLVRLTHDSVGPVFADGAAVLKYGTNTRADNTYPKHLNETHTVTTNSPKDSEILTSSKR